MRYAVCAFLCCVLLACQENKNTGVELKTHKDTVSYAVGLDIGRNLKTQKLEIDPQVLAHGLWDMYAGGKTVLTDSESRSISSAFRKEMRARHAEDLRAEAEKNRPEGIAFLAENKKNNGVVALPTGLQYKILRMGTGEKPKPGQTVTVNYRGTLLNGTEFKSGDSVSFSLNGVIKGWAEALQLMPAGSKWMLYIPPELAYGEMGAGLLVQPNATLIFELELLEVR